MTSNNRLVVLGLLAVSIALLIPGLFAPVLTIRGVLTRDGVAHVAPMMLERGLSDETVAVLKSMLNPAILAFMEATGVDLRKTIIDKLTPAITNSLQRNVQEVPVYEQTRSILGSVRQLYKVGSPVPATLILLFSVVVPVGKGALVAWAMFMTDARSAGARCASWRRSPSGPWPTSSSWRCSSRTRRARHANAAGGRRGSPAARRVQRPLRRGLLLVRRVLHLLAGVAAVHQAPGHGHAGGAGGASGGR